MTSSGITDLGKNRPLPVPTSPQLKILYQDAHLIAVHKRAGQLVHPSDTPQAQDIITMKVLRDQIGQEVEVVHRLDCPTCGVLLFGLQKKAAKILRRSFEERRVKKAYLAAVHGTPTLATWIDRTPLRKGPDQALKSASTHFTVLSSHPDIPELTLLEAHPHTGRFHQIRRHLSEAGHPIIGDFRYAGKERSLEIGLRLNSGTRMHLQAWKLEFPHPISEVPLTLTSPPENIFQPFLQNVNLC